MANGCTFAKYIFISFSKWLFSIPIIDKCNRVISFMLIKTHRQVHTQSVCVLQQPLCPWACFLQVVIHSMTLEVGNEIRDSLVLRARHNAAVSDGACLAQHKSTQTSQQRPKRAKRPSGFPDCWVWWFRWWDAVKADTAAKESGDLFIFRITVYLLD